MGGECFERKKGVAGREPGAYGRTKGILRKRLRRKYNTRVGIPAGFRNTKGILDSKGGESLGTDGSSGVPLNPPKKKT